MDIFWKFCCYSCRRRTYATFRGSLKYSGFPFVSIHSGSCHTLTHLNNAMKPPWAPSFGRDTPHKLYSSRSIRCEVDIVLCNISSNRSHCHFLAGKGPYSKPKSRSHYNLLHSPSYIWPAGGSEVAPCSYCWVSLLCSHPQKGMYRRLKATADIIEYILDTLLLPCSSPWRSLAVFKTWQVLHLVTHL